MENSYKRPPSELFVANRSEIQDVLDRLRAEYLEMPGLRLKPRQVQRLCGVERTMCQLALDSLLESKFLCVKPDGHYARLTDGAIRSPRSEKADLRTDLTAKKAS